MKVVNFNLDPTDGLISLSIKGSANTTNIDIEFPLTAQLEEALLKQALGYIKDLMAEKSDLTGGAAKL